MTTTDTDALQERIARALYVEACEEEDGGLTWETEESVAEEIEGWERFAPAVLPIVAEEVRKAKAEALKKRWVCQVARSGYHNGASCRPDDAHSDWGCDYYYEASIRATEYETGDSDEHR